MQSIASMTTFSSLAASLAGFNCLAMAEMRGLIATGAGFELHARR
jgi:hypothetical protein